MKVILVDQHHGHTRTIVLKGWLKGLLSLCILGAPVALGYLGYQVAVSGNGQQYTLTSTAEHADKAEAQADESLQPPQQETVTYTYTPHQFLQDSGELEPQVADRAQQRNGYIARFEHSDKFLASAGDVVRQGQLIELASNVGRSTGPWINFKVYRHGRVVDPASYIQRTER